MITLNAESIRQLIEKYGPTIDLRTQSALLAEILKDVNLIDNPLLPTSARDSGYDRTYERGYDREDGYNRTYVQYDKTTDYKMLLDFVSRVRPEILESFNPELLKRYQQIMDSLKHSE